MAEINIRKARTIIRKTLEKGREMDLQPLAVVVVDAGGHVIAFEREDGSPPGRFPIAQGKAYAVVMMGKGGEALHNHAEQRPQFAGALASVYHGQYIPVPGGILVRSKKGEVLGAVGVSGDTSANDAEAGLAGILSAGLLGEA
ncbi:heme-binding protein [Cognatishimia sp. SS12]|uniref:GlcG/HbpS family heme-binding protein n=1 Tax=Cognatishimia sp. SS12 TaxID=2979465 RepID=UPI002330FD68|nr:heme-binding protein [Cognatishimia sp. SS12]MDC0736961.1 heme-binding protein [Cognatishimia sp. SS12]